MMHKDTILTLLTDRGQPLCDACIRRATGITPHQTVNQNTRHLENLKRTRRVMGTCRDCGKSARCNVLLEAGSTAQPTGPPPTPPQPEVSTIDGRPWYWEGHVQATVVRWLEQQGWTVVQAADTAARTPGIDIVAKREPNKVLWTTVKGFPERSRHVQARHWFAGAIFDLVTYRDRDADPYLALALPDGFVTYRNLAGRIGWLKEAMRFSIFWVAQDGSVRSE
jgi:hypothetical protein